MLTTLPSSISVLINLKELYVNSNDLTILPTKLFKCTRLSMLDTDNNPLQHTFIPLNHETETQLSLPHVKGTRFE